MTALTIRPARREDLERLARWNHAVDRVVAPTLARQELGEALVLLATVEAEPVGHLLVDFTALAGEGAAHLWHMAVRDPFRNRGVGSALLAAAGDAAAARGLAATRLEVEKANPDGLRLYRRLGYEVTGEQDEVWPEPDAEGRLRDVAHPCWVLRRRLATTPQADSPWARSPSWCPRPRPSPELLDVVRDAYGFEWRGDPVDLVGGSSVNLGLSTRHVLRVHRAWVTPDRLDALQAVRRELARRGLPFVVPTPTRTGDGWIRVDGHLAEVEPFVEGEDMDPGQRLLAALPLLARAHAEMRELILAPAACVAPAANHVAAESVEAIAAQAAAIVRSWRDALSEVATTIETLAREIAAGEAPYRDLPRQLVHGDFWDNNVLFRDGRVVAVLDLDFMEAGPRIDDLALVLYYAGSGADLPGLVRAYATAADPPLRNTERLDLPFAIARTCLHFTRHLALRIDEREQREVLDANRAELAWGLEIARNARRWQEAFGA